MIDNEEITTAVALLCGFSFLHELTKNCSKTGAWFEGLLLKIVELPPQLRATIAMIDKIQGKKL